MSAAGQPASAPRWCSAAACVASCFGERAVSQRKVRRAALLHGHDGFAPRELLETTRSQLARYDTTHPPTRHGYPHRAARRPCHRGRWRRSAGARLWRDSQMNLFRGSVHLRLIALQEQDRAYSPLVARRAYLRDHPPDAVRLLAVRLRAKTTLSTAMKLHQQGCLP